jgi:hypothetical protein
VRHLGTLYEGMLEYRLNLVCQHRIKMSANHRVKMSTFHH